MTNRNRWPTGPTSPGRDPVLTAMIAAAAVLAVIAVVLIGQRLQVAQGETALHCPAPDHPVWAATLHQWLCGDSLTAGVKAR